MTQTILITLLAILSAALLFVWQKNQKNSRLLQNLQDNLKHARNELSEQEQLRDEMNYEMTQLRIQLSSLKVTVNRLSQYQHVSDIEQYVLNRRLQVDSCIELTKMNAEILLNEIQEKIAQVNVFLNEHQRNTQALTEQKAQEKLRAYWAHAQALQERDDILQALERKINGYQRHYFAPIQQLQHQLIGRYGASDAAQHLQQVRMKIEQANTAGQVAECHYLDENRRLAAIALVTLVFNTKAELYLALLNSENLGQLLQELRDDYLLINFHGNHFSNAQLHESYLNLRLEELKFMALMQAEPLTSGIEPGTAP
ncbi:hypothetical protein [Acinetobacter pragensis]|uniref:SNIPE associated domain-containing protein n=1 Tax=Acinetobacter pragensis TaxID=1806892 RepID=A0A151Y6E9_9GAMM|nr:hypothetical protein [Acinetobacter pragensis]KYQ73603.1 hypothetical protein AZH43_00330 [Acinetobacter pragensis]